VIDATGNYTDELNAFDTFIEIEQGYAELMRHMRYTHNSLLLFVGGDNVIVVCPISSGPTTRRRLLTSPRPSMSRCRSASVAEERPRGGLRCETRARDLPGRRDQSRTRVGRRPETDR